MIRRLAARLAERRARLATENEIIAAAQSRDELLRYRVRRTGAPVFDQTVFATGTLPRRGQPAEVDALIAELDLLALPITTGTLGAGRVTA